MIRLPGVRRLLAVSVVGIFLAASCSSDDSDGGASINSEAAASTTSDAGTSTATEASVSGTSAASDTTVAEKTTTTEAEEASVGGSATLLLAVDVPGWDPVQFRQIAADSIQFNAVYDTLVRVGADGTIQPRLALSVSSTDAVQWTIKLRPNVTFSDGTPFNADAVVFNWTRFADPENASPCRGNVLSMASFEATDPLTVTVTLNEAQGPWPRLLERCLGVIGSPSAITEKGADFGSAPVGAGPFTLKDWTRDAQATLVRNPLHWDSPRPYLDEVVIKLVPDTQQRADSFAAGEADLIQFFQPDPRVEDFVEQGLEPVTSVSVGGQGFAFNTAKPPLDDARVRRALALATDLDEYREKVYGGDGQPVETFFDEGSPYYDPSQPKVDQQANLDEAQELIDAYVAEKGGPVKTTVIGGSTNLPAEVLAQQWSKLNNVEVTVQPTAAAGFVQLLATGQFDIAPSSVAADSPFPIMPDRLLTGSPTNFGKYSNPQLDEFLREARTSQDLELQKDSLSKALDILVEDAPYIFTNRVAVVYFQSDKVDGLTVHEMSVGDLATVHSR